MALELLQHQHEGVDFLTGHGAGLLAFEQGLGKTFVAIEAFQRVLGGGLADKLLVICPNSLKRNWVAEFTKFAPSMSVDLAEGSPKRRRAIFGDSPARVLITSYETARSETTALIALVQRQRTVLVLDESHATKNWRSLTSTAARMISPYCEYRWLLSGTPVTNMRLLAVDTIEEAIVLALERKSALARSLLGDENTSGSISQLTKEEMCELLKANKLPSQ